MKVLVSEFMCGGLRRPVQPDVFDDGSLVEGTDPADFRRSCSETEVELLDLVLESDQTAAKRTES